jgi:hypothetical protein
MSYIDKKALRIFFSDGLIIHVGGLTFKVQSESIPGHWYTTCIDPAALDCECKFWRAQKPKKSKKDKGKKKRRLLCKHMKASKMQYAVRIKRDSQMPSNSNPYKNPPWYNAVKRIEKDCVMELLRCLGAQRQYVLADFYQKNGKDNQHRPPACVGDLLFCAGMQAYENTSSRFAISAPANWETGGFLQRPAPSPKTLGMYMVTDDMTQVLRRAIAQTGAAVAHIERRFGIDSAFFRTPNSEVHRRRGDLAIREVNAQLQWCVGLKTLVAVSAFLAPEHDSDQNWFIPTLEPLTNYIVESVHADSGYSKRDHYDWVRNNLGGGKQPAMAWIDFKDDKRRKIDPMFPHYSQMLKIYLNDDTLWHKEYHQRSLVEVAHHILKARFKRRLRSRLEIPLENELLALVLVHNLCRLIVAHHQFGLEIPFADDRAMSRIASVDKSKFGIDDDDEGDADIASLLRQTASTDASNDQDDDGLEAA